MFMSIFQRISKSMGSGEELDLDSIMSAAEKPLSAQEAAPVRADAYVKSLALQSDNDLRTVQEELGGKNMVLLNISALSRNPAKLKLAVTKLTDYVRSINGDIARIDEDKILLTPANVKIVKKRK